MVQGESQVWHVHSFKACLLRILVQTATAPVPLVGSHVAGEKVVEIVPQLKTGHGSLGNGGWRQSQEINGRPLLPLALATEVRVG